ncbi:type I restriction enzyme, S subunit [Flaviramulus basaltis]|uniref:Type I restriction enzyme, S subunit n=1 Tax=Flaviramulus basaltis TaxID=369401 RepID=A0A1K2IB52_9FLAO|nr:restriction endonuclease subunit S [Flaviramulus basaltis]SFZ89536.1 type I restriction enzyme, S subunit [Flaviramulus basaltis]
MSQNTETEFPSSWFQVPLSDLFLDPKNNIVDGPFGSNLKASEYQDEGIPVIRIQNIDRNRFIDKNINYVSEEKADFLSRHSFKSGDIIITKLGDPVGKACFVPKKYETGIIVADLIRARIDNKHLNDKFLLYQLNSSYLIKQFDKFTKGTTRPRIKLSIVRDLIVNLAPIKEQLRIVEFIEELFSELDNGVDNLKLAQSQLKVYRQALLKYAFEGKLTEQWRKENNPEPAEKLLERIKEERHQRYEQEVKEWKVEVKVWEREGKQEKKPRKPIKPVDFPSISKEILDQLPSIPRNWKWIRNNDLLYYVTSGSRDWKKYYANSGAYFIRTQDIKTNKLKIENAAFVNLPENVEGKRSLVQKGDLLMTITGANVGKVAYIKDDIMESYVSQSVALMKPINTRVSPFLHLYFQSDVYGGKMISGLVYGIGRPVLSLENMRESPITLCSFEEQEEIISSIESQFSIIDNLEKTIESGLQKSEALRQSILKKAFEGKLVLQDPKDEPASKLLKRIQAEKKKYLEEQKKQKKRKPKNTKKMSKELSIEEVLKTSDKPMLAKDVWQKSKHRDNIEDFYKELKDIQLKIKEVKKGTESLLSLAK